MLETIPFDIPARYAADIAGGSLQRYGALLKHTGSGRIIAHLQETGLAQKLLSNAACSPFSPLQVLNIPSSILANVQLAQLKSMVEGLRVLQFVNLGATVAGIGVSAMGFYLMNRKLNGLQSQMTAFADRVETRFLELHERELRTHYSRIHGCINQAAQAHTLTNPSEEWRRISHVLADESAYFRGEAAHLVQNELFESDLFEALTHSYSICNAGRIECLLHANELNAAQKVSQDVASNYNRLFDPLIPARLAHKSAKLEKDNGIPLTESLNQELLTMQNLVSNLREIQDTAASRPYLVESLLRRGIDGNEYMKRISNEKEHALLVLEAA